MKHTATSKHREALASHPLTGYFQPASASDQLAIQTEVLFANFVKDALHPHFAQHVIGQCRAGPFSIMCDEGNDKVKKNFALLVHQWDEKLGKPVTRFLHMPVRNIDTAENLFNCIDVALKDRSTP